MATLHSSVPPKFGTADMMLSCRLPIVKSIGKGDASLLSAQRNLSPYDSSAHTSQFASICNVITRQKMETTLNIRKHNCATHVVFMMGSRLLLGGELGEWISGVLRFLAQQPRGVKRYFPVKGNQRLAEIERGAFQPPFGF